MQGHVKQLKVIKPSYISKINKKNTHYIYTAEKHICFCSYRQPTVYIMNKNEICFILSNYIKRCQ